jgi:hypothetical protein
MTVQEVIDALSKLSPEVKAKKLGIWLPGSVIEVTGPDPMILDGAWYRDTVLIEGNVRPGSALDR